MPLPIVEIFGPTLQGEGPAAGTNAAFVRLGGCNLSCSWCDTPESWDGARFDLRERITMMTINEIEKALPAGTIVVLSGGEPLLHQGNPLWPGLLALLVKRYGCIHVETNGTIAPSSVTTAAMDLFVVSPKLPNAGAHRGGQVPTPVPIWADLLSVLKIVVQDADDVGLAVDLADRLGMPHDRLWVMPEGVDAATLDSRWPVIAQAAASAGINASHRLQLLAGIR